MYEIILLPHGQIPAVFIEGNTICLPPSAPPPSSPALVAELKVTTIMTLDGVYNKSVTASAVALKTYEILVHLTNNTEYLPPSSILVVQTYTVVVEEPVPSNIRELLCLPFPRQSYDFMQCIIENVVEFSGLSNQIRRFSENLNNTYTVSVPMTIDGYPGREPSFNNTFNYSSVNVDGVTIQTQTRVSDTNDNKLLSDANIEASKEGLSLLIESGVAEFVNETDVVLPLPPGLPPLNPGPSSPTPLQPPPSLSPSLPPSIPPSSPYSPPPPSNPPPSPNNPPFPSTPPLPPSLPPPPSFPPSEGGQVNVGIVVGIPIIILFVLAVVYFRKRIITLLNKYWTPRSQVSPYEIP